MHSEEGHVPIPCIDDYRGLHLYLSYSKKRRALVKRRTKGFLTERQLLVLKLRRKGMSHEGIAKILNTTRENVMILEKRAFRNIRLAKETLEYAAAVAGETIHVSKGTRIVDIPGMILGKADEAGLKLSMSMPALITEVSNRMRTVAWRGIVQEDIDILILPNGNIRIVTAESF